MAVRDGDGWVACNCGSKHWGLNGAAGIVLLDPETRRILLQLRSEWTHGGRVWGIPGGARDSHETPIESAMREMFEETQIPESAVSVFHDERWTDHGDWHYHTVLATSSEELEIEINDETEKCEWIPISEVADLDLHPGLRTVWSSIQEAIGSHLSS
jgi:8-oxo-dGTP diphosphatase